MATIQTALGPVSGFVDTHLLSDKSTAGQPAGKEQPVVKYLGLPFGQAGRWEQARPVEPWTETKVCNEYGPVTPQIPGIIGVRIAELDGFHKRQHIGMSELGILTLNIYASQGVEEGDGVPVLVWIYGGSWKDGSAGAMLYDATEVIRASPTPIIIVTLNYRVNFFGFLAAEDLRDADGLVGNYGLRDQLLGLKWVKTNINKFGGSSDNVTIYGESAGAVSVLYHMVGRDALFKRAIAQSGGSATMPFTSLEKQEQSWQLILQAFNINSSDKDERVRLAKEIPMKDILSLLHANPALSFGACPEQGPKAIWTEHPAARISRGEVVPSLESFMSGVCTDEGLVFAHRFGMFEDQSRVDGFLKPFGTVLPLLKRLYANIADVSKHTGSSESHPSARLLHDVVFEGPVKYDVEGVAKLRNVKCFAYRSNALAPSFRNFGWGVHHASELPFVFKTAALWRNDPDADESKTANDFIEKWISFAATGKPDEESVWPQYTQSNRQRYVFENGGSAKSHLEAADLTPVLQLQDGVIRTVAGLHVEGAA